jgi:hypothetical protein
MIHNGYDVQGRFLGIPYDWRLPRLAKVKGRVYKKGGPMFPPKVWGWGWTLNLAHPGTKVLLGAIALLGLCATCLG